MSDAPQSISRRLRNRRRLAALNARAKRIPWWIIGLICLLIYAGYQIAISEENQDILSALLDRPKISTDDKFDVVFRLDSPITVLNISHEVRLPTGARRSIPDADLIEQAAGTLVCDRAANPSCLDESGIVARFRFFAPPDVEPDGIAEGRGLLRPNGLFIDLLNGDVILVDPRVEITERESGTLECNRLIAPDCEDLSGEIVTFTYPYTLQEGLLNRTDVVILHDDGYIETVRPNRIKNLRLEACDEASDPICFNGEIQRALYDDRVVGKEVGRDDDTVRVRTVNEQTVFVPAERVLSRETGTVRCDRAANPRCQDFEGEIIEQRGTITSGLLSFETNRSLNIIPEGRTRAVEIVKLNVVSDIREPENCRPGNIEEPCFITAQETDSLVRGSILEESADGVLIQTVAPVYLDIPKAEIVEVASRVPGDCALNNLRGCNEAIWLTLLVTIVSYGLALVVGLIVGLMRTSSNIFLYHSSTFYVELVRGMPLLVILFIFAYVLGPELRKLGDLHLLGQTITHPISWFYSQVNRLEVIVLGKETFLAEAVLGLAFGYGAFLAEVFRAGIQSIGRGQLEAARSLGLTYPQAMQKVILPQAVRVVLPPLGNDFIAMLKDSSLVSVLALTDLLRAGREYAATTFQALPAYFTVALLYIIATLILSMGVRYIERRMRLPR